MTKSYRAESPEVLTPEHVQQHLSHVKKDIRFMQLCLGKVVSHETQLQKI